MTETENVIPAATKPAYQKPSLLRGAELQQIAAAMKGISDDGGPMACWVARAVYGADNPRWLLFRDWLAVDAPAWLRSTYLRHGSAFARVVARSGLLRRALRPLMDRAIRARFAL